MTQTTWIVVANGSKARVFNVETLSEMTELHTMIHPASHLHDRDLRSEKAGRSFSSTGSSSSDMNKEILPKEKEFIAFAKEVASWLNSANSYDRIFLAAAPEFLGLLRKSLNKRTLDKIEREVAKDLTTADQKQVLDHFYG